MIKKNPTSVLVVEDNKIVCKIIREEVIQRSGYEGFYADSVQSALLILQTNHIDVIVLDIKLNRSNGFDLIEQIVQSPQYRNIRVLFLTNLTEIETRLRCFDAGANDYLPKPFFPEELRVRLGRLLGGDKRDESSRYDNHIWLNMSKCELHIDEVMIPLSGKQSVIVNHLIRSNGFATRESMLKLLGWEQSKASENRLRVEIARVNERVAKRTGLRLIKSRRGVGYHLCN